LAPHLGIKPSHPLSKSGICFNRFMRHCIRFREKIFFKIRYLLNSVFKHCLPLYSIDIPSF